MPTAQDRFGSEIRAQRDDPAVGSPGEIREWFFNYLNSVLPPFASAGRPQIALPGTDRRLDLMAAIGLGSDLIDPGKGAQHAALLAPGWVRNPVRSVAPGERRAYVGAVTVPGKRMPVRVAGNFHRELHQGPAPPGSVWRMDWLGAQSGGIEDFERGPKGAMWGPATRGLGRQGLLELFERFKADEPAARWVTWHRAGGRSPFGNVSEGIDLDIGRFINPTHGTRPPGDPRFERYREFMRNVYGVDVNPSDPGTGLTSRNIVPYDPLDEP